jgi:hypothetical protein
MTEMFQGGIDLEFVILVKPVKQRFCAFRGRLHVDTIGAVLFDECDLVRIENFPNILEYLLGRVWSRFQDAQSFDLAEEDKTGDNADLLLDMTEFVFSGRELEMLSGKLPRVKGSVEYHRIIGRKIREPSPTSFLHKPGKVGELFFIDEGNDKVEAHSSHADDGDSLGDLFGFEPRYFFRDRPGRDGCSKVNDISHARCKTEEIYQ